MAWNGSADKGEATSRRLNKTNSPLNKRQDAPLLPSLRDAFGGGYSSPIKKGLLAGLIVVIGGGLAAWFFMGGESGETADAGGRGATRPTAIAEVAPAIVTNAVVAEEAVAKVAEKPVPYWKLPTTNGLDEAQIRKWKFMHEPPPHYTNDVAFHRPPPEWAIFKHRSENELALLMTLEPGMTLVGTPIYGDAMRNDFLKSCEEPILAEEGDTEEQRQLKKEMNEIKIEIRDRMRNGEDFCDILRETREEMMRLGRVRQEIQNDLSAMLKDAKSEVDVDTCIEAANKLLEDKGLAPISVNPVIRRRFARQFQINEDK